MTSFENLWTTIGKRIKLNGEPPNVKKLKIGVARKPDLIEPN
jgi:hypothetical protein